MLMPSVVDHAALLVEGRRYPPERKSPRDGCEEKPWCDLGTGRRPSLVQEFWRELYL